MFMILLLMMCVWMFSVNSCSNPRKDADFGNQNVTHKTQGIKSAEVKQIDLSRIAYISEKLSRPKEQNPDSMKKWSRELNEYNQILKTISDNQKVIGDNELLLQSRTDSLARENKRLNDDIRQETNNIVNKMNAWLAFWIAALAFVGVIIPIALQFKLYREEKDKAREFRDSLRKELDDVIRSNVKRVDEVEKELTDQQSSSIAEFERKNKNLEINITGYIENLKSQMHAMKEDFIDKKEELGQFLLSAHMAQCCDYKLIPAIHENSSYKKQIWNDVANNFMNVVEDCFESRPGHDHRGKYLKEGKIKKLIQTMIDVYALVSTELRTVKGAFERRTCRDIQYELRQAIRESSQHNIRNKGLYQRLQRIISYLERIRPRVD